MPRRPLTQTRSTSLTKWHCSQYTSGEFKDLCFAHGVIPSVRRTGTCFDNATAESSFATIKKELINVHVWPTLVKTAMFNYIAVYYNRKRRHSSLGYQTPEQYELNLARAPEALRSISPSDPSALKRTTQSRTICSPTPPARAASLREPPS